MKRLHDYVRDRRGLMVPAGVGVFTAAVSMSLSLSYDEAFWLGISRMVREGAILYETAIDNKSPVIYALFGFLDALPGPFVIARALVVGSISAVIAKTVPNRSRSGHPGEGYRVGLLISVTVVLLAAFRLQTELLAAPLAVHALHTANEGRATRSTLLSLIATCVTPLAAGLIPVSLFLARKKAPGAAWRQAAAMTIVATLAITIAIASTDNLRFGLIELNVVSRNGLTPLFGTANVVYSFTLAAMSLLPLAVLVWAQRWPIVKVGALAVVALPAVFAGFGFPHYWIIVASAAGVVGTRASGRQETRTVAAALSLIPLLLWTGLQVEPAEQVSKRYQTVAELLAPADTLEWTYVQADLQPFLAVHFPARVGLYSPSINYLAWETSRSEEHRTHLREAIQRADVLVDPGLANPEMRPLPALVPVLDIFASAINRFACSIKVDGLTVHATESVCTAIQRSSPTSPSP